MEPDKVALAYDPFARGRFPVGVRTTQLRDPARARLFPAEIWYPASAEHAGQDEAPETQDTYPVPGREAPRRQLAVRDATAEPGRYPLVLFSHHAAGNRRSATFLCTHLSSHGYLVAALDHSEVVAPELSRPDGETAEQRWARMLAVVAGRVPDARLLLDQVLDGGVLAGAGELAARPDPGRVGVVGHSIGGWTALALPEVDPRAGAVVALAPAGSSIRRPGVLPAELTFDWARAVPTLYLAAEQDVSIPLAGLYELYGRTPAARQLVVLRRADHGHFLDHVEEEHEAVRAMSFPPELSWLTEEMRPIGELSSGAQAHLFARGLTLAHLDATLREQQEARLFLAGDIAGELAARGVEVTVPAPEAAKHPAR